MTITLNIPQEIEETLRQRAAVAGVTLSVLLEQAAVELAREPIRTSRPQSGAELVAQLEAEGVLGLWSDREDMADPAAYAAKLRERSNRREW